MRHSHCFPLGLSWLITAPLLGGSPTPSACDPSDKPLLVADDLSTDASSLWWSWTAGQGSLQHRDDTIRFLIPPTTADAPRSNAEIQTPRELMPYRFHDFEISLSHPQIGPGSRGWGFWNSSADPLTSEIAWFGVIKGSYDYPLSGFFAITQQQGKQPQFFELDEAYLQDWHTYRIAWCEDRVRFYIDGKVVAEDTDNVPQGNMRIHVWVDNAVYNPSTFQPVTVDVPEASVMEATEYRIFGSSIPPYTKPSQSSLRYGDQ